jgi:hypothetical protein
LIRVIVALSSSRVGFGFGCVSGSGGLSDGGGGFSGGFGDNFNHV